MRFDLSDNDWALLEPLMPKSRKSARVDDRKIMNGIFYVLRTGMPWRDLPERYGPYTTAYIASTRGPDRGSGNGVELPDSQCDTQVAEWMWRDAAIPAPEGRPMKPSSNLAHDVMNELTVILMGVHELLSGMDSATPEALILNEIHAAAQRAALLLRSDGPLKEGLPPAR